MALDFVVCATTWAEAERVQSCGKELLRDLFSANREPLTPRWKPKRPFQAFLWARFALVLVVFGAVWAETLLDENCGEKLLSYLFSARNELLTPRSEQKHVFRAFLGDCCAGLRRFYYRFG